MPRLDKAMNGPELSMVRSFWFVPPAQLDIVLPLSLQYNVSPNCARTEMETGPEKEPPKDGVTTGARTTAPSSLTEYQETPAATELPLSTSTARIVVPIVPPVEVGEESLMGSVYGVEDVVGTDPLVV